MTICTKFRCLSVQPQADGSQIKLQAVTGGSAENDQFFKYTPNGSIDMGVVNPDAAEYFESSAEYIVTFEKAQK